MHWTLLMQIISGVSSPSELVNNVPDSLATEIPPTMLIFPDGAADISVLNKKTWTSDQVSPVSSSIAEEIIT